MELRLVDDAGDRLVGREVADELLRERPGLLLILFRDGALERALEQLFLARQLGGGEAETRDAVGLGEQRVEALFDAVFLDDRRERRRFACAHEQAVAGAGRDKRRVRLLGDLRVASRQHAVVQRLDDLLPVRADRRLIGRGRHVVHAHARRRHFLVGGDRVERARVIGHVVRRARPRIGRILDGREVLPHERLDRRLVEVADRNHGHQVRAVPVVVELLQQCGIELRDVVGVADRQPIRVARAGEQHRKLLVAHPRRGAAAAPPFFGDDLPLLVDDRRIEHHVVRPVLEDQHGLVHDVRPVGRNLELVDRLVEARERVDARAELHADRLHERDDLLARIVLRAVERHVLDEVREPALAVVLEHGSGVDDESQLRALFRLAIRLEVVAQAIRKPADGDLRIGRHRLIETDGLR